MFDAVWQGNVNDTWRMVEVNGKRGRFTPRTPRTHILATVLHLGEPY